MEDKEIKKLNIEDNLPSVPRKEDGSIDLEQITLEVDEKNNRIIPNDIFDSYYRELPSGVINQSRTWRTANNGKIKILSSEDKEIQKAGGEALQATLKQRRKMSETIDIFLKKRASIEEIEQLGLEDGATKQDALIAAMMQRAIIMKDVQAFNSLRDTVGEKPTEKISAEVETITAEDRERIEKILSRENHNI